MKRTMLAPLLLTMLLLPLKKRNDLAKLVAFAWTLFVTVFLLSACSNRNTVRPPLHFLQYNAYLAAPVQSAYFINLAFVTEANRHFELTRDMIEFVEFPGYPELQVTNIRIIKGALTANYQIQTLVLDLLFAKEGAKSLNTLRIKYPDGSSSEYGIGQWTVDVDPMPSNSDLRVGDKYPLMTQILDNYMLSLDNLTDTKILIKEIVSRSPHPTFHADNLSILPKSSLRTNILPETTNGPICQYYFFRPKIIYEKQNQYYAFYPEGVYWGLLSVSDQSIKKEIEKERMAQGQVP